MSHPTYRTVTEKKLLRIALWVMYPFVALAGGGATWLTITLSMPDEPHPVLYGAGTAVLMAAYMYFRTWLDFREKHQRDDRSAAAAGTGHDHG